MFRVAVLVGLTDLAFQQFILDVYDSLNNEDQRTLKQYFAAGNPTEMRAWITSNVRNVSEMAHESVKKVVAQYQQTKLEVAAT